MKKSKYIILCPKCKTTHDCSDQMNEWKEELFKDIDKLVKEKLKNE